MNKLSALIELYVPGMVLFDPQSLDEFLTEEGIDTSNLFELFLENENIGRKAIDQGVVLPIYQITEETYSIFLEGSNALGDSQTTAVFSNEGFSLRINSGLLICSDLNALLDWDREFFINYKNNYEDRLPSNDYLDLTAGLYNVCITGYRCVGKQGGYYSYGLSLSSRCKSNSLSSDVSIESFDFELVNRQ